MSGKFDYLKYDYVRRRTYDFYVDRLARRFEAMSEIISQDRLRISSLEARLEYLENLFPRPAPRIVEISRGSHVSEYDSNEGRD